MNIHLLPKQIKLQTGPGKFIQHPCSFRTKFHNERNYVLLQESRDIFSFGCRIFNFIKGLSGFSQFLIHHQKFLNAGIFLWVFSNQEDDVFNRDPSWATNIHCFFCLQNKKIHVLESEGGWMFDKFKTIRSTLNIKYNFF